MGCTTTDRSSVKTNDMNLRLINAFLWFLACSKLPVNGNGEEMNSISASRLIDCDGLVRTISDSRNECVNTAEHTVDLCLYFAQDYEYLIPNLVHHLGLGFSHIRIYNNDEVEHWFNHPTITCLIANDLISIQPWHGVNLVHSALDHCFESISRHYSDADPMTVWGAVFDADEFLVLHKERCVSKFVEPMKAPGISINWAFFVPALPWSNYSIFGDTTGLRPTDGTNILLPHDILVRRKPENIHIKTIARVACVENWKQVHFPIYGHSCGNLGWNPIDPEGRYIAPDFKTPWVANWYPVAQLNHYWSLNLAQFVRKSHRGYGGDSDKTVGTHRNSGDLLDHMKILSFVNDTSFIDHYGTYFKSLKTVCPHCFDLSFMYFKH